MFFISMFGIVLSYVVECYYAIMESSFPFHVVALHNKILFLSY